MRKEKGKKRGVSVKMVMLTFTATEELPGGLRSEARFVGGFDATLGMSVNIPFKTER